MFILVMWPLRFHTVVVFRPAESSMLGYWCQRADGRLGYPLQKCYQKPLVFKDEDEHP